MYAILALSVLLRCRLYDIGLIMLYYTCRALYSCKPKTFLKSYNRTYVGDAQEPTNVTRNFNRERDRMICVKNIHISLVKVLGTWYEIPIMLVPYVYFKKDVGFCAF